MSGQERRGLFITLEGVEGCGKSTQARLLVEHLDARGIEVVLTREPGGTDLGERLREILLDIGQTGMRAETELFLYLASRAEHVAEVIVPALKRGAVVISDRFGDASVAYQGGGRGLGADLVRPLNETATSGVKPDVSFLLDLDAEEGLGRLDGRIQDGGSRASRDRIESEAIEFHRMVRQAYLDEAAREPERFVVLDARSRVEELARTIALRVDDLLAERAGTYPGDD
jgi:dTMP kinase